MNIRGILAAAVRASRPRVEAAAMAEHGSGPTRPALIAIVANKALYESDAGAARVAQALREHAELLEVREHIHDRSGRA